MQCFRFGEMFSGHWLPVSEESVKFPSLRGNEMTPVVVAPATSLESVSRLWHREGGAQVEPSVHPH